MTTRKPSADEQALFREAMRNAKPLAKKRRGSSSIVAPAKAGAQASPSQGGGAVDPRFREDDKGKIHAVTPRPKTPHPLDAGRIADLDKRTGERFKQGEMAIDGKIDLHGLTQAEAHDRLQAFLAKAEGAGKRCVLVITGKGAGGWGVLRESVPRWLNEPAMRRHLLAFAQAQPRHGGAGALYLLLKRRREP